MGEQTTIDVFANQHWNATHVFLTAGHEYRFEATGEWYDSKDACDWHGTENGELTKGDVIRSVAGFLGKFERLFHNNASKDFYGTKRVENLPWFCMVGAIANDNGNAQAARNDGSAIPHEYAGLHEYGNKSLVVRKSGYLYCFANDAWAFYENNRGSIQLTIRRLK